LAIFRLGPGRPAPARWYRAFANAQVAPDAAGKQRRQVDHRLRAKPPKLAALLDEAIVRLAGAILTEQNDEWAVERARYVTLGTIAPVSDSPIVILPALAG
jgi:hypothetical protein